MFALKNGSFNACWKCIETNIPVGAPLDCAVCVLLRGRTALSGIGDPSTYREKIMATIQQGIDAVLAFAQSPSNIFTASPTTIDDTIVPAPGAMDDQLFLDFLGALRTAMG